MNDVAMDEAEGVWRELAAAATALWALGARRAERCMRLLQEFVLHGEGRVICGQVYTFYIRIIRYTYCIQFPWEVLHPSY